MTSILGATRWPSVLLIAAAQVAFVVGSADPSRAATTYLASCNSGIYAPRVCTLVAGSVVAGFASIDSGALIVPVRPTVAAPSCSGGAGRVEEFAGRVSGPKGVGGFGMRLTACPNERPTVSATLRLRYGPPGSVWQEVMVTVSARFGTVDGSERFEFLRSEKNYDRGDFYSAGGTGSVYRRYSGTGVMAIAKGDYQSIESTSSNGGCDSGCDYGTYTARVDSSISGHWARLYLVEDDVSTASSSPQPATRWIASVRSEPRSSGWLIVRTA